MSEQVQPQSTPEQEKKREKSITIKVVMDEQTRMELYRLKIETQKPIYRILEGILRHVFEDPEIKSKIIERIKKDPQTS